MPINRLKIITDAKSMPHFYMDSPRVIEDVLRFSFCAKFLYAPNSKIEP